MHARWWDPRLIQNLPQFGHSTRGFAARLAFAAPFAASASAFSASAVSAAAFLTVSVTKPEFSSCRMYLGKKVFILPLSIAFSDGEFELVACSWHLHRVVVVDIGSVGVVSGDNCYDRGGGGGSVSAAFDVDGGVGDGCGAHVLGDWMAVVIENALHLNDASLVDEIVGGSDLVLEVLILPDVHRSKCSYLHRAHLVFGLLADRAEGGSVGNNLVDDQTLVHAYEKSLAES